MAQIRIRPAQVLKGRLPPSKLKAVLDWAASRETELMRAWAAMESGQKPGRIDD